ncbi:MAG: CDP-diacylglycerol--serine O-phosphatidyltransferase [Muribaculaceae bacterium]
MSNKVISFIPNILTLCNLLSGCIAIYMALHLNMPMGGLQGLHWCWIFIAAAAVFDFCDGASARGLHAYSNIGAELDSLSDVVSFGVAPAMLMLNTMVANQAPLWLAFVPLLVAAFGALRLAIFNVDTTQTTTFRGLPIPANAIFWIGISAWIQQHGYPGSVAIVVLTLLMSWLMVSRLRMFSLKLKSFAVRENFRRYALILATVMFIITEGVAGLIWAIVLYILISAVGRKEQPA